MSDANDQALQEAYDLIEDGRSQDAVAILQPLLVEDEDNPDVWWLYAHAVDDIETARMALNKVLKLDPNYPDAVALMNSLEQEHALAQPVQRPSMPPPPTLPMDTELNAPSKIIDDDEPLFPPSSDSDVRQKPAVESRTSQGRGVAIIAAVILILVVLVVAIVALLNGGQMVPASVATSTPVSDVVADSTDEPDVVSVQTASPELDATVTEALQAFTLSDSPSTIENTVLGETLLVNVCSQPGESLRNDLSQALFDLTPIGEVAGDNFEAIGLQITDCESGELLRAVGVPLSAVRDYADETIDNRQYQEQWTPIR